MKYKELETEAQIDLKFDPDNVESMIIRSSINYQKWIAYQLAENIVYSKIDAEYNKIKRGLMTYYREDYPREFKTSSEFDMFVTSDEKLYDITQRRTTALEKCKYIEQTVKNLYNMNFQVKNYIDWVKYQNGF